MTDTAGVGCHVHPLWDLVCAAAAGRQTAELLLCELGSFFQKDPVVFLPLVFPADGRVVAFHVAKPDVAAVAEFQHPFCGMKHSCLPVHQLQNRLDDRVFQILIPSPDDQYPQAGIPQTAAHGFSLGTPALSATSCAAEADILDSALKKLLLRLRIGTSQIHRHRSIPIFHCCTSLHAVIAKP